MPLVRRVLATLAVACAECEAVAAVTTASPCLPLSSSGSALKAAALVHKSCVLSPLESDFSATLQLPSFNLRRRSVFLVFPHSGFAYETCLQT